MKDNSNNNAVDATKQLADGVEEIDLNAVQTSKTEAHTEQPPKKTIGWKNVTDANGVAFSLFGISVVFIGLITTFLYITALPWITGEKKREKAPKKEKEVAGTETANATTETTEDRDLQAAIAYVIASEIEYEKMTDYTKITFRRDENQQVWGVAGKMRSLATRKISRKL